MGYTLNSRLGRDHMRFLYECIARDPDGYAAAALVDNHPAGVITGVQNAQEFMGKLVRRMPVTRLAALGLRLASSPPLLAEWRKGQAIAAPVLLNGAEVRAVLTAIVVDAAAQGMGVGRALVEAFEVFLRAARVPAYRLDTLIKNETAIRFYEQLGFQETARRADSIIFVRQVAQ